ncbi:hypothetical protein [Acetobacter persici]|uniref:hypothetical protein n=1 Tax=Acetobacter persici TaxID=1076596 RepID=UPI001BA44B2E|nr:hypothetical protein [Acetobacter persici]MBS1015393.1 hypothetical protein [Acetobacter persici]
MTSTSQLPTGPGLVLRKALKPGRNDDIFILPKAYPQARFSASKSTLQTVLNDQPVSDVENEG